jgi:hypothetical protein
LRGDGSDQIAQAMKAMLRPRSPPARTSRRRCRRALDRRAAALCLATIWTICASMVSRPTFSARITRPPVWLIVPPISFVARFLGDRHGLAGDHRFIDRAAAFDHHAIDRHLLAGAHAQRVADRTTGRA